jgi:hypothetical protein
MNSFSQSRPYSALPSISDLDGYTIWGYNFTANSSYMPADKDEFGFDPPSQKTHYPKVDTYRSADDSVDSPLGSWPGFEREDDHKQRSSLDQAYHMDKAISQSLPNTATAVARFGQVTPPRTNSSGSVDSVDQSEDISPRAAKGRRRKSKQAKELHPPAPTASGRKRKNTCKSAANAKSNSKDTKRKASLEKNKLAAAKCRVNKKEKIEILQRDSREKAVHNAFLKNEVMRMKEEIQQLNAILLAHTHCDGCKSPKEIQKHLRELGAEYLPHQISLGAHPGFPDYHDMQLDSLSSIKDAWLKTTIFPSCGMPSR